nr:MAG TPA: hypothetical protein [Caudoviricetes sp.]
MGFMIYHDDAARIDRLSDADLARIIRAAIHFAADGEEPNLDPLMDMAFAPIKEKIARDAEKYMKKREAGAKGGSTSKAEAKQTEANSKQAEAETKQTEAECKQTGVTSNKYLVTSNEYPVTSNEYTILSDCVDGGEAANACARETHDHPDTDDGSMATGAENVQVAAQKPKKPRKPTDAALIAEAIRDYADGDAELEGLLQDWMANRKAKRQPQTIRAIQLNLDKLDAMAQESGMPVKAYLRDVIARGWAAFYAIKEGGGGGYRASPRPQQPQSTADFYLQMMQDMD